MKKKLLWVILGLFLCFAPAGTGWSANLLGDADFETNTGKWTESCSLTGSTIATQDPSFAHSPSRFAWMGGYDDAADYVYQDVTIPADATSAYLQFWYSISTEEEDSGVWDKMVVDVRSPSDNPPLAFDGPYLRRLVTLSNANQTNGYVQSPKYDLSEFNGQKIRLVFYVTTDYSLLTNFDVDDVELVATGGVPSYSISGKVTFGGNGLAGVTMTLGGTGSGTTSTDSNGNYSFNVLLNGIYSVTPEKGSYIFSPSTHAVEVVSTSVTGQDFAASFAWEVAGTADFNGDGQVDLLWRNRSTGQNSVWLMNGAAIVSGVSLTPVADPNWQIVGTADFNGDGQADLLWRNLATGQNSVWLMNGTAFVSGVPLPPVADANWEIVGTADFNSDGAAVDLLWRNRSTGQNSVWLMNGTAIVSGVPLPPVADANWEIVGTADFNGDGAVDLLWRNRSTGENSVWLMNGTAFVSGVSLTPVAGTF